MFVIAQKILLNKKGTSNGRNVTFFSIRFQLDSYVLEVRKHTQILLGIIDNLRLLMKIKLKLKLKYSYNVATNVI